jgi:YesN/AraC family two-component response regulator
MNDKKVLSPAEIAGSYIREYYYRQDLSVGEIAEFIDLTPNYFVNVFKKEFKMTIRQYLILTRLEASQALLKTQKYLVRDVAKLTGWSNQYYFSNCFKKYYKYSPSTVGKNY